MISNSQPSNLPFSLREKVVKPARKLRKVTGREQEGNRKGCGRAMDL